MLSTFDHIQCEETIIDGYEDYYQFLYDSEMEYANYQLELEYQQAIQLAGSVPIIDPEHIDYTDIRNLGQQGSENIS